MDFRFYAFALASLLAIPAEINCQLNGVKPLLIPCYNVSAIPGITIANNRPPTNLNVFLELLRRLEDANPTVTIRDFSALILQRLQQSGIILSTLRPTDLSIAIPFSPYGYEAIKTTVFLHEYLTNSSQKLDYGDLDQADLCYFHYMISNTINSTLRGDESSTCVRSAQYQMRMRRDSELLNRTTRNASVGRRNREDGDTETVELSPRKFFMKSPSESYSDCPVQMGVMYTNHGTVTIGDVLRGLAAAFNQEQDDKGADNRYATTLAGNLAHSALMQADVPLHIGTSGGWNSSINPKYFFLQKNTYTDLTDQDIRGSVDGLLLAKRLDTIHKKYNDIKLSQIIDMYYSPSQRGVFDPSLRACNRNILYSEYITGERLTEEVGAVIGTLDRIGQYPVTVIESKYDELVDAAVNNFSSYLPQINDPTCPQTESSPIERTTTDLLIFLDHSLSYSSVQPIISHILDGIDVNKYNSRYTLYSGTNGVNITNHTNHLIDFHKAYNLTVHDKFSGQFDYSRVYEVMESTIKAKLNNNTYKGGESTIALLVTKSAPSENEKNFLNQRKEIIKQFLPDTTVLVLGYGSPADYSSVLLNPNKDFITLSESNNENDLKPIAQNVIDRIKTIPRAIVNPNCGYGFKGTTSTVSLTQYVDLHTFNYYRIAPNYFFKGDGGRSLKIQALSTGSITYCISRNQSRPDNQNTNCKTLQTNIDSVDISSYCTGSITECSPIYLSIYGNTTQYGCRDYFCRFPDSIKFTITLENVRCTSGSISITANFLLISSIIVYLLRL
ncbi:unnamed protein product [Phyllotreta striolata]|uniref:VWFA domain-containing protein n=1 Tax=Phyllotreta striolata TaxID=444603 RepID=A0A9N9TH37_PHYSR|nr:unnamed protein product [Phyllotreta striolata]